MMVMLISTRGERSVLLLPVGDCVVISVPGGILSTSEIFHFSRESSPEDSRGCLHLAYP
jgi:hypothetical protein